MEQVADRIWVFRDDWFDVNAGVIAGETGLVIVDALASAEAAAPLIEEVRRVGAGLPVVAVVATHAHFDHALGSSALLDAFPDATLIAHEDADLLSVKEEARRDFADDPRFAEIEAAQPVAAATTFCSAKVIDLGDRLVELLHLGRGHTGGDLVVWVPEVRVLFAGDLVEAAPQIGADAFAQEWPATLDLLAQLLPSDAVVVPGHGAAVGKDAVVEQRFALFDLIDAAAGERPQLPLA